MLSIFLLKHAIILPPFKRYPVKWGKSTNMEAVTHTMLGPLMQKSCVGAFKSLDAFDFSIEHLSLYERRLGLMNMEVFSSRSQICYRVVNFLHCCMLKNFLNFTCFAVRAF